MFKTNSIFVKTTLAVVAWRVALFMLSWLAPNLLAYKPSFPYALTLLPMYHLPQSVYSWANFDGVHYLTITDIGYVGIGLVQAFFPVYPVLMKLSNLLLHNSIMSGLSISFVCAIGLALAWVYFLRLEGVTKSWWGLAVLFLFPTSFFFAAVYTESLFLLLVVVAFIAARKQWWWLAGLTAALVSATRIVGICLVPALGVELLLQISADKKIPFTFKNIVTLIKIMLTEYWRQLIWILVGMAGLVAYMVYLYREFHDPLYFLHVQAEFGTGRQEQLILYPQVVWRYLKILTTFRPFGLTYYSLVQEAVAGTVGLVALVWSFKKVRLSYLLFSLGAFLIPTLTGTFSSLPRYILVCFPLYLLIIKTMDSRPRWQVMYLLVSTMWMIFNTILFIQGYWVA